jgi:uncharacterized alkaline shock family protein YloU
LAPERESILPCRSIIIREVLKITGKLIVNDQVFVDIALAALQKVDDVIRQQRKGTFSDLSRLLTGKFASKINVQKSDSDEGDSGIGTVSFDLRLVVTYGVVIPEVAAKVREAVIKDVTTLTGYKVDRVDIVVEKLVRPEEIANEQA